jgi:ubiquitin-like modifier-activating enzyme ATG7
MKQQLYETLHSQVDPEFWSELSQRKLSEYRLDKSRKAIFGTYETGGAHVELSSRLRVNGDSFLTPIKSSSTTSPSPSSTIINNRYTNVSPGYLLNTNTIDEFKEFDKKKLLRDVCIEIIKSIVNREWIVKPNVLTTFAVLSFADLKNHLFYYWFTFPAIVPQKQILQIGDVTQVSDVFNGEGELDSLVKSYLLYQVESPLESKGFFLVTRHQNNVQIHPLSDYEKVFASDAEVVLGFNDPSSLPDNANIILKNYLIAAALTFKRSQFSVLCVREGRGGDRVNISLSVIVKAQLDVDNLIDKRVLDTLSNSDVNDEQIEQVGDLVKVAGWEKNNKGKTAPRYADVSAMMDPMKLAASSVSLNLELMKWRMFPQLDLSRLSGMKSLLIGSGTLGCHVARNLMAWGMFNITMVDRSKVSYSNPVRQPLYEYEDCLNGGKDKAQCAVDKLLKIYPLANVRAESLEIPMPGHVVADTEVESVKRNVELLERLIEEHDVIFLLTDTRESRWLPSVIGAQKKKIVLNAALGYESYVVMRHGVVSDSNDDNQFRLGCYFCNDVVAPVDSTKDRTLDMQCTVTRPGVSAMAGALAVELLVALVHHEKYKYAPASILSSSNDGVNSKSAHVDVGGRASSDFGWVPHQIRGSITNYQTNLLVGTAYDQCTACSEVILNKYSSEGFPFLLQVFNTPSILEELTGLKELHAKTQQLFESIEDFDEDW